MVKQCKHGHDQTPGNQLIRKFKRQGEIKPYKVCKICVFAINKKCNQKRRMRENENKLQEKSCIVCNKLFETVKLHKKTCSIACSKTHRYNLSKKSMLKYYQANKERISKKRKENYVPVEYNFSCIVCGQLFVAHKKHAMYCSQNCATKISYQKHLKKRKLIQKEYRANNKKKEALRKKIWRLKKLGREFEIKDLVG